MMSNRKGIGGTHLLLNESRTPIALVVLDKIIVTSKQQTTRPRLERYTSRFQF